MSSDSTSDSDSPHNNQKCSCSENVSTALVCERKFRATHDVPAAVAAWLSSSSSDSDRTLPPESDETKKLNVTPISSENLDQPLTSTAIDKSNDYLERLYKHFFDSD